MEKVLTEADTRAKLIDPILHQRGWTEELSKGSINANIVDPYFSFAKEGII